jgi:methylase of polypeptide subunit release factors
MYNYKISNQEFVFETAEDVFFPTGTTRLIISSAAKAIKGPKKILDLGCGMGIIGIVLSKLGCVEGPIYGSDLSEMAVGFAIKNAIDYQVSFYYKTGSLFEPWNGEKFDVIVEDVPGISSHMQKYSDWFHDGVPFDPGEDGTELVCQVIEQAHKYLNPNGSLIFPVLSLSNVDKIIKKATDTFKSVQTIGKKMWGITNAMQLNPQELWKLHEEHKIVLEEKFGLTLWYTEIFEGIL